MEMNELKAKIEAVLFVTAQAMQPTQIAELLEVEAESVEEALLELVFDYSSRDGALEIDDEDGYIIQVKAEYLDIVEKLCPVDLRQSVLKTLTVIALKEPIKQSALMELRPSASDHIKELLEKELISRSRAKDSRSFILHTTKKFAEYFKLKGDAKTLAKYLDMNKDIINS